MIGDFLIAETNEQGQTANNTATRISINKLGIVAVDGAATIWNPISN